MYCVYYQATVVKKLACFVVGYFRSEEHFVFERALEGTNVFEFFVPPAYEELFCQIMASLQRHGSVIAYEKLENRYLATAKK